MLDHTAITKAIFTKLEKATAAVPQKEISEGREQNPLSTMHWTMENHGSGYRITMMRGGIIVARRDVEFNDVTALDTRGKRTLPAPDETFTALVSAMFKDVPVAKKAA
jgi:hypothetical protein